VLFNACSARAQLCLGANLALRVRRGHLDLAVGLGHGCRSLFALSLPLLCDLLEHLRSRLVRGCLGQPFCPSLGLLAQSVGGFAQLLLRLRPQLFAGFGELLLGGPVRLGGLLLGLARPGLRFTRLSLGLDPRGLGLALALGSFLALLFCEPQLFAEATHVGCQLGNTLLARRFGDASELLGCSSGLIGRVDSRVRGRRRVHRAQARLRDRVDLGGAFGAW
jgi:hypothetical protein